MRLQIRQRGDHEIIGGPRPGTPSPPLLSPLLLPPPGYSPILGHSSYLHNDSCLLHSIHRNEEIGNNVAIIGPLRPEPGTDPGRLAGKIAATKLTRLRVDFNLAPLSTFLAFPFRCPVGPPATRCRLASPERPRREQQQAGLHSSRSLGSSTADFTVHYASCHYFFSPQT